MMAQGDEANWRTRSRKPNVASAMRDLIRQIRIRFPLDLTEADACNGDCRGCSRKLMEFLRSELDDWEVRLDAGERPGLADLSRLVKMSRQIHRVLRENGLIGDEGPGVDAPGAGLGGSEPG